MSGKLLVLVPWKADDLSTAVIPVQERFARDVRQVRVDWGERMYPPCVVDTRCAPYGDGVEVRLSGLDHIVLRAECDVD